ncbi:Hypothetical predicted protein [Xyrichtys novacula]|uniref:Uncharacterized protein n=1 Tax=Xyrichtys novacula TaxID=13765 RepID=A0AAV1GR43_XYRNO|nr:Hypothetical predicted protein [Xyrichtys novacula]
MAPLQVSPRSRPAIWTLIYCCPPAPGLVCSLPLIYQCASAGAIMGFVEFYVGRPGDPSLERIDAVIECQSLDKST